MNLHRMNLLNLKKSSHKLEIVAKRFLKLPNLHMLTKQEFISSQKLCFPDFFKNANTVLNEGRPVIPPLLNDGELLSSGFDKTKLFAKNFSKNSNLHDSGISLFIKSVCLHSSGGFKNCEPELSYELNSSICV